MTMNTADTLEHIKRAAKKAMNGKPAALVLHSIENARDTAGARFLQYVADVPIENFESWIDNERHDYVISLLIEAGRDNLLDKLNQGYDISSVGGYV